MEPTSQYHPYRRIVLIFVGFVIGVVAISAVIMILQRIFYRNPYGNEIRIDNFADYYEAVPTDPREHIFNLLYNIVADNTPDTFEPIDRTYRIRLVKGKKVAEKTIHLRGNDIVNVSLNLKKR